jgi:Undecaprenyl-phosphate glucose phosphotransferase
MTDTTPTPAADPAEQKTQARQEPIDQPTLVAIAAMADTAIVIASAMLAAGLIAVPGWPVLFLGVGMSAIALFALQRAWVYTVAALSQPVRQIARTSAAMAGCFAGAMALAFGFGLEAVLPRGFMLGWFVMALAAMISLRVAFAFQMRRWLKDGRLVRRAVIVGGGRPAEELIRQLRRSTSAGIKVCGVFDDRAKDRSVEPVDRYRVLGTFDEMAAFCRAEGIDLIIVTLPATAEERILQLMKKLWELPIDVRISAHHSKLRLRPRAYSYIGDIPFLAVFDKPLSDWGWAVKEIEDRVLAAIMILLLSPVMIGVALTVKFTSRGPIIFRQKRHGFNNQLVEVYKFRSMYTDMCDAKASRLVTKDDPRVTPVGRFIRKSSLDELPQLFNVLKGELSLVGPRPHATQAKAGERIYNEVVDGYYARHRMKPGITGLAQIHGWRGETDTEEKLQRRVEYDIQYIDNWSVWMDLYILAMTPVSLLNTKNAY